MSACDDLSPLYRPAPTDAGRSCCPTWCLSRGCAGDHRSPATSFAPEADAAHVTTRLLGLDGAAAGGNRAVLVSLGVEQLELLDKPSVELLPREARQLAASLLWLADLAERPAESPPPPRGALVLPTPSRRRRPLTSA